MRTRLALALVMGVCSIAEAGEPKVYTQWPFDAPEAKRRQAETAKALGVEIERDIDIAPRGKVRLVLIPEDANHSFRCFILRVHWILAERPLVPQSLAHLSGFGPDRPVGEPTAETVTAQGGQSDVTGNRSQDEHRIERDSFA
ncbi:hypothetical protein HQ560_00135 [bacterium]|nr:hypothetical protein [bacterium]